MRRIAALSLLLAACPTEPDPDPILDDDDDDAVLDDDDAAQDDDDAAPAFDWSDHWRELTAGVSVLEGGGSLPSSLVVHGDTAFPVVLDENDRTFIAAGLYGAGRFAVFGHEGYLHGHPTDNDDQDVLSANAASWTAAAAPADVTVAHDGGFDDLAAHLTAEGFTVTTSSVGELETAGVDVWVASASADLSAADVETLRGWVEAGGGLLVGGQAWYWSYSNDNTATEYPANKFLNPMGVTYGWHTHVDGGRDEVGAEPPGPLLHARHALQAFLDHLDESAPLTLEEQRLGVKAAGLAIDVLPLSFEDYFAKADELKDATGPILVTSDVPLVRADRPIDELVVTYDTKLARELPADELFAHPAGTDFPGAASGDAETVTVSVDATHAGIHSDYIYAGARAPAMRSTGVYAPPGAEITVTVPAGWVGQGLEVQVGAHTDGLWGKDEWERYPTIVRRDAIDATQTRSGNAFGGLVYVRVPTGAELGDGDVTVAGGIRAPWYVHGETTHAQFIELIGTSGSPWAELQTDSLILTVPTSQLGGLDDAPALMDFWDDVQDANATLSGFDPQRPRAERIVVDRQISAGWMHSGYPIMAHLVSGEDFVDLQGLQQNGNWGAFHELGHNHQWRDWVLPGTTETTCNLFSIYVSEEVVGIDRSVAHSALDASARRGRVNDYVAAGADLANWSVWTALETYLQLQEAFGWRPFTGVFTEQRGWSGEESPDGDQERIDAWILGISQTTERNLVPFFEDWGFTVSQSVQDATAGLAAWDENPMD